jgi:hypothetical protein
MLLPVLVSAVTTVALFRLNKRLEGAPDVAVTTGLLPKLDGKPLGSVLIIYNFGNKTAEDVVLEIADGTRAEWFSVQGGSSVDYMLDVKNMKEGRRLDAVKITRLHPMQNMMFFSRRRLSKHDVRVHYRDGIGRVHENPEKGPPLELSSKRKGEKVKDSRDWCDWRNCL